MADSTPVTPPDLAALKGCVAALMDGHMECVLPRACYEDWKALLAAAPWLLARAEEAAFQAVELRKNDDEWAEAFAQMEKLAEAAERERDAAQATIRRFQTEATALRGRCDAEVAKAQAEAARLRAALTAMQNHWQTTYHDDNSQACVDYFYRAIDAALAPPPEGEKQTP